MRLITTKSASSRHFFGSHNQFLGASSLSPRGVGAAQGASPPLRQGSKRPSPVAERSARPSAARKDSSPPFASSVVSVGGAARQHSSSSSSQGSAQTSRTPMNQEISVCERTMVAAEAAGGEMNGRAHMAEQQLQQEVAAGFEPQEGPTSTGVPVYVMLPLDTVNADGVFRYASSRWFLQSLQTLAATGIRGVAVDVWWGAVERKPRRYDWSGYRQLFNLIKALGLKIQVVMSFHACGGNVGDNAQIPLPKWVLQCGERDPDIFFTDRPRELSLGQRNKECISIFADEEPALLKGRSPIQCYTDFMRAFREEFHEELGEWVEEVVVGCGPCGELRYPSYVETNGWRFPGIGEFQCYDRRALASLAQAACAVGHPEWGNSGPHDAGNYNSTPEETGFFCSWGGSWDSPYGRFFLGWYSGALIDHGDRMLRAATSVFNVAPHTPSTSPVSASTSWPLSKPPSLWDLPAPSRPPGYAPPRLMSASAPMLHYQSNSSTEEAPQQAQQAAEGSGSAADIYLPGMFDAPLVSGVQQQQLAQQQPYASPPAPPAMQQPSGWGGAGQAAGAQGSSQGLPAAFPSTPPSQDLGFASSWNSGQGPAPQQQPQQAQQAAPPGWLSGPGQGQQAQQQSPMSPLPLPGPGPSPLPSPMSVGMLSQPPSLASLRSSISESAEDLTGVLPPGEVQPAGAPVGLTLKVAGVHWWFRTRSHAAELTAGYYNTQTHPQGYAAIAALCAQYGASLTLTCVEMCDSQHPPEALCGPEGLLRAVREVAAAAGVPVAGENALPCFMPGSIDEVALQRVIYNTQPWGTPLQQGSSPDERDALGMMSPPSDMISSLESSVPWGSSQPGAHASAAAPPAYLTAAPGAAGTPGSAGGGSEPPSPNTPSQLPPMRAFTFLRLSSEMMTPEYQEAWARFTRVMAKNAARFKSSRSWRQSLGLQ